MELWHTTKADARHLQGIPGPSLVPAVIKIIALQAMYGEDALKPPTLPYCCGIMVKQEDTTCGPDSRNGRASRSDNLHDGSPNISQTVPAAGCY